MPLFRLLQRNILENGLGHRIVRYQFGRWPPERHSVHVGWYPASDGRSAGLGFRIRLGAPVNLGGIQLGETGIEVPIVRIDDTPITDLRYVKIDVEGAEGLVLAGMEQTIGGQTPIVLFETRDDRSLPEKTLRSLGAELRGARDVRTVFDGLQYSIHDYGGGDFLAVPSTRQLPRYLAWIAARRGVKLNSASGKSELERKLFRF